MGVILPFGLMFLCVRFPKRALPLWARSTHSPDRKAAVRDLSGLNGGKVPDCCPIERVWPTAVVAEECELAFQQFSGYSRRLKGCFPESSNSGRLLSDDISVVRMTNLGGQL